MPDQTDPWTVGQNGVAEYCWSDQKPAKEHVNSWRWEWPQDTGQTQVLVLFNLLEWTLVFQSWMLITCQAWFFSNDGFLYWKFHFSWKTEPWLLVYQAAIRRLQDKGKDNLALLCLVLSMTMSRSCSASKQTPYVMNDWKQCCKMLNSDKDWNLLPVILSIKELDLLTIIFFPIHVGMFYTPHSRWTKMPF